jgi:hypothetical protein
MSLDILGKSVHGDTGRPALVSASDDQTFRVWDFASYTCRFTHRGAAAHAAVAVTMTTILASDSAGTVWFLDVPPSMVSPAP